MSRKTGYYRFPTIHADSIIFVSEDDLWLTTTSGGTARRLTAGMGECSFPRLSPDGKDIAFIAREEGHSEVYVMPGEGGDWRRLTYMGSTICTVDGWTTDGKSVLFVSNAQSPFFRGTELFSVPTDGGAPVPTALGHVISAAAISNGGMVIGRNNNDPARWKRYRGGTAGELWIDANGHGEFKPLIKLSGNLASPMYVNGRVYFLSDHEGVGNIYSCTADGKDLRKHTTHHDYYVRYPATDGRRIVYAAGADLFVYDPSADKSEAIDVSISSAPRHAVRRFVPAFNYLEHFSVHPQGHTLSLVSRGQPFTAPFWEDAVVQHGPGSRARYRHTEWLPDGKRFLAVTDADGYERLELHHHDQSKPPEYASDADLGRVVELVVSPTEDTVVLCNHRHELFVVDLKKKAAKKVDRSPADRICGLSISPDGRWVAYSYASTPNLRHLRILDVNSGKTYDLTRPLRSDFTTAWDPNGNYLYFLGAREFNPVYDSMQFDLSFPYGVKPYAVPLRKDVHSPFRVQPQAVIQSASGKDDASGKAEQEPDKGKATSIHIDFDGIQDRVLSFPVEEGRYTQVLGLPGRAAFIRWPVRGIERKNSWLDDNNETGELWVYDYEKQEAVVLHRNVRHARVGKDGKTVVYLSDSGLRVVDGTAPLPESGPTEPGKEQSRKTGWIDTQRIHVLIEPHAEWQQMFAETWRLQREHFWDERMSGVDWDAVLQRYLPLLNRINSRAELSDLIWEMQGELGTSHAYEMLGDHRRPPSYDRGFLGADLEYDVKTEGYRITRILRGDSWDRAADSPLSLPGLNINVGDVIVAVGGRRTSKTCPVDELLINAADKDVMLTILEQGKKRRQVAVRTLKTEMWVRYRDWVETNRKYVHDKTGGKVGYVHIPDMGPLGFAEFHRYYLAEIHREALVVDVRWNRGGHVSPLLLEKLARKRVGYDVSRWGMPVPYPPESVAGPIVGITNQFAGSDGDIFSHCFKLFKLGPLVGKRTWGGVIGIWPRHLLVDGTMTTQPEFSFWFTDVGWKVENYGTDPDYEVDIAPQDSRAGRDPQMDKAIELVLQAMDKEPFQLPPFDERPSLPLPSKEPALSK